jgi:hypothetical protein
MDVRVVCIALSLVVLAPAAARAAWTDPVAAGVPRGAAGAVTANGTTAFAWADGAGVHARVGTAAIDRGAGSDPRIASAADDIAIAWSAGSDALVALGTAAPTDLGAGTASALSGDAAGAFAVLVVRPDGSYAVSYRPPGGAFGVPASAPTAASGRRVFSVPTTPGLAVGPAGEQVVTWRSGGVMYAASRAGDGAFAPPAVVAGPAVSPGEGAAVALDAHGRALAAWQNMRNGEVPEDVVAVRGADGAWREVTAFAGAPLEPPQAATGDEGQALLGWVAPSAFDVVAVPLDTGVPGMRASFPLDLSPERLGPDTAPYENATQSAPVLRAVPDGSATVTWAAYRSVLVSRRDGTGAFSSPTVAGCQQVGLVPEPLGFDGADHAYVLYPRHPGGAQSVTHDGVAGVTRVCPRIRTTTHNPHVTYGVRHIVAGRRVRIRVVYLRRPTASMRNHWQMPDRTVANSSESLAYTFPKPGRVTWSVHTAQTFEAGDYSEGVVTRHPTVFASATLSAGAVPGGVRVRASAFTPGGLRRVRLVVDGARVFHRRLGLHPVTLRLPVRDARSVKLVQGGTVRARARVR